jgi:hypothetical protein
MIEMELSSLSDEDVLQKIQHCLTSRNYPWSEIDKGLWSIVHPLPWSQIYSEKERFNANQYISTDDPSLLRHYLLTLNTVRDIQEHLADEACSSLPGDLYVHDESDCAPSKRILYEDRGHIFETDTGNGYYKSDYDSGYGDVWEGDYDSDCHSNCSEYDSDNATVDSWESE